VFFDRLDFVELMHSLLRGHVRLFLFEQRLKSLQVD
jgi:hypothetical protein